MLLLNPQLKGVELPEGPSFCALKSMLELTPKVILFTDCLAKP